MLGRVRSFFTAQQIEHLIRGSHARGHEVASTRWIAQVAHAHSATPELVFVSRSDATPRRADLLALLAGSVQHLVIRKREVRAIGNEQPLLELDAALRQTVELGKER